MHKGHEGMHTTMILILIGTLVVAQFVVVEWKKRHYRSYALFTMVAMWCVPLIMSARSHWWRFVTIWSVFTLLTALVMRKSSIRPMSATTPR
ncbi:E3 ubiquitin ligase Rnf121-like [Choristoneura fumiferana]